MRRNFYELADLAVALPKSIARIICTLVIALTATVPALAAQSPVASVIAGATKPEQVRANASADWEPTPSDLTALRALG